MNFRFRIFVGNRIRFIGNLPIPDYLIRKNTMRLTLLIVFQGCTHLQIIYENWPFCATQTFQMLFTFKHTINQTTEEVREIRN